MSGTITQGELARLRRTHPELFTRPLLERAKAWGLWLTFVATMAFGLWWVDANPMRIVEGLNKLGLLVRLMIPPHPGDGLWDYVYAMAETLGMAFLGTVIAAVLAVPLGFLGAKNVMPNWLFHFGLRRFYDGFRGIDGLVWALIFVSAVGLGPFAGVLAIAVGDLMIFAKLFAVMRLGVFPQVFPVMLSHVLYFFESNVRSATILGIVGAGGIGLQLSDRMRINKWDQAAFIILMILVTVAVIDNISRRIRMKLIQAPAPG